MYSIENENAAILQIQNYLLSIAYHDGSIPTVPLDGVYGSETKFAVRAFQKIHELKETGCVDRITFEKLKNEYEIIENLNHSIFPKTISLENGDNGEVVELLHILLHYDEKEQRIRSSYFGNETTEKIKGEQKKCGLPEDGKVNHKMLDYLLDLYLKSQKNNT